MFHVLAYVDPSAGGDGGAGPAEALGGLVLILGILVVPTSIWVAIDAPKHGLSMSWALGCLALWIIAFPWYLVVRGQIVSGRAPRPDQRVAVDDPMRGQPRGWYPDPRAANGERFWDGRRWTAAERRRPTA